LKLLKIEVNTRNRFKFCKGLVKETDASKAYPIVCGTASAKEFKKASRRLSEEIAKKRRKPVGFEKLFQ